MIAFVDTTVFTNAVLKTGDLAEAANRALARFEASELPVYAIKEFKAGPLTYYAWIHNKFAELGSYADTMEALQRLARGPQRYRTATALEAIRTVQEEWRRDGVTLGALEKAYGAAAKEDTVLADRMRLSLRRIITRAWDQRRTVTTRVVHELTCYNEAPPRADKAGILDLRPKKCDVPRQFRECCLAGGFRSRPDELRKLEQAISPSSAKREDQRRRKALHSIRKRPSHPVTDDMCRSLGDAVIVLQAPQDSAILTTNVGDFTALAAALAKKVEAP